jgi:hypothetical protein
MLPFGDAMAEDDLSSFPGWFLWPASLHAFIVYDKSGMSTAVLLDKLLHVPHVKPHRPAFAQTDARQLPGAHLAPYRDLGNGQELRYFGDAE